MLFGSREVVRLLGNFEEYAAWILEQNPKPCGWVPKVFGEFWQAFGIVLS
jgi:hypothetical protein